MLSSGKVISDGNGGFTMIGDTDPLGDVCSTAAYQDTLLGKNIGDLLNAKGITWGWFQGGFDLTVTNPNGTTGLQPPERPDRSELGERRAPRLHPAPRAVPVLPVDGQSEPLRARAA